MFIILQKLEHLHRRGLTISAKLEVFATQLSINCKNIVQHGRLFDQKDESAESIENLLNNKRVEQDQLIKDLELAINDIESFQEDYSCRNSNSVDIANSR